MRPTRPAPLLLIACLALTAAAALSGCMTPQPRVQAFAPTEAPTAEPSPTVEPVIPTAVAVAELPAAVEPAAAGFENADILRFTFPTPGPEPVSLWRPPLYDTPWALSPYDHFYFSRPIAADVVNWPLADYRYGGIFFGDSVHTGIDIPNPKGTPVMAAAPGKVIFTGYGLFYGSNNPDDPYGQAVSIEQDFGYQGHRLYTIYAHLSKIIAVEGQRVEAGTVIGLVGDTGNTTGPHLHFEVRLEKDSFYATRNPELWLAPPQGWGVLVARMMNTNTSLLTRQEVTVRSLDSGQKWTVITYGSNTVNSDDYYRENLVLSDLPAGEYQVSVDYLEETYKTYVSIHPGAVSYIKFQGKFGFNDNAPLPTPDPEEWLAP